MSHFTVVINDILDQMKASSGITRQSFAERIGMSISTLSSYTTERNKPTAPALAQIASGLEERDAARIIVAHLTDETPAEWHERIGVRGDATLAVRDRVNESLPLKGYADLPVNFRRQMEALLHEARSNGHVIGFIDEFVTLLNLPLERMRGVPGLEDLKLIDPVVNEPAADYAPKPKKPRK